MITKRGKRMRYNKIFIIVFLSIILLYNLVLNVNANEETDLTYRVYISIYKYYNNTWKKILAPEGDLILDIKINKNNVIAMIRPMNIEEFRYYSILTFENSIIFPLNKPNNITAAKEYTKYIINQFKTNNTFVKIMYQKYLQQVYIKKIVTNYNISEKNNYLLNYPEVGFFPLYSIISLNEKFIKKYKPVYYNSKLTTPGIISESLDAEINHTFIELPLYAHGVKYRGLGPFNTELYFKRNYLVHALNVLLPLNKTYLVLYKSIEPTKDTISFLDSVPDYKLYTENYWVPVLIVSVIVLAGVGVIAWRKRAR